MNLKQMDKFIATHLNEISQEKPYEVLPKAKSYVEQVKNLMNSELWEENYK